MKHRGWLLDPYIQGKYAILWLKTVDGEIRRLRDRYTPSFYAEPEEGFKAEEVALLLGENPARARVWYSSISSHRRGSSGRSSATLRMISIALR